MPTQDQGQRLDNIMGWIRTAKETLPAINESQVSADRVAQMSALLDRLHACARSLRDAALPRSAQLPRPARLPGHRAA